MLEKNKVPKSNLFDFEVTIKRKNNKFLVSVPELNLFSHGKNIEIAMANLEIEFKNLKKNYINFFELSFPKNDETFLEINNKSISNLKSFFFKSLIISICIIFTALISTTIISNKISQISFVEIIRQQKDNLKRNFITSEKNLNDFRDILKNLEPYVNEIQKTLNN